MTGLMLDVLIFFIFAVIVISGMKNGFVRSIASVVFSIIAIIAAKEFAEPVGQWLNDNFIHENLIRYFEKLIQTNASGGTQAVIASIPPFITENAQASGVSLEKLIGSVLTPDRISDISVKLAQSVETLFSPLITALGYIAVLMLVKLTSGVAIWILSVAFKLPLLRQVNKLLGLIFGFVKGALFVLVVSALLMIFENSLGSTGLGPTIASSSIVKAFGTVLFEIIQ